MKILSVAQSLRNTNYPFPNPDQVKAIVKEGDVVTRHFARLWLSEGTPYAFISNPGLYETIRFWIAVKLNIHPKDVNLSGSGRVGWSFSPTKEHKKFNSESDLDFFTISEDLFELVKSDFNRWENDFINEQISPSNINEKGFWKDNAKRGSILLSKGFLDTKMVPNRNSYLTIQMINQTMANLVTLLKSNEPFQNLEKVSLRCYKDWDSYCNQMSINLKTCFNE